MGDLGERRGRPLLAKPYSSRVATDASHSKSPHFTTMRWSNLLEQFKQNQWVSKCLTQNRHQDLRLHKTSIYFFQMHHPSKPNPNPSPTPIPPPTAKPTAAIPPSTSTISSMPTLPTKMPSNPPPPSLPAPPHNPPQPTSPLLPSHYQEPRPPKQQQNTPTRRS
jgi:hypothetical protein